MNVDRHKRIWWGSTIILALGMVVSACDVGGQPTPTAVTGSGATQGSLTGKIDFQVFGDPVELAVFQEVARGFKEVQPNAEEQRCPGGSAAGHRRSRRVGHCDHRPRRRPRRPVRWWDGPNLSPASGCRPRPGWCLGWWWRLVTSVRRAPARTAR